MAQTRDPLLRAALADWRRLAPFAGLDPAAHLPEPLGRRQARGVARIVLRMRAEGRSDVVFKRVFRPRVDPGWAAGLQTQRAVRALLPGPARPAPVMLEDADAQAAIFGWVPGKSLNAHLLLKYDQPVQRADALRRAGDWLAQFHAATDAGPVAFHASPVQLRLSRLMARAEADPAAIVDADLFIVLAQGMARFARAAQGAPVQCAALHGDLTANNMVLGVKATTAIDFCTAVTGPVLHEVAKLLADIAARFGVDGVPRADVQAFEEGYGARVRHDPVFDYLLRAQLLFQWAALGPMGRPQTAFTATRIEKVQGVAKKLMRPQAA
ncbi:phosphotransferase [Tropicimonas sp. S265A]|uniref:phosphotransferase n=1 Tax=Tropicimonas sp. S265A TaxID=3415134 RepID=UPI003C7EAEF1